MHSQHSLVTYTKEVNLLDDTKKSEMSQAHTKGNISGRCVLVADRPSQK